MTLLSRCREGHIFLKWLFLSTTKTIPLRVWSGTTGLNFNKANVSSFSGSSNMMTINSSGTECYALTEIPTINDYAYHNMRYSEAKRIIMRGSMRHSSGSANMAFGVTEPWGGLAKDYTVTTGRRIVFLWDGGTLYAITSTSSGSTVTTITGITRTNMNDYKIDMDWDNTTVKFYVNGVLKATHTTHITTHASQMEFGYGLDGASNQMNCTSIRFASKLQ